MANLLIKEAAMGFSSFVQEDYLKYLDELRDSGTTSMFGAAPYLERQFNLPISEARKVLAYWMETFSERQEA